MAYHRASRAEISLDAFRHNLLIVRSSLDPRIKIMAVVKADAYGHGAVPCAKAAVDTGADYLGVGIIEEGIELRKSGIEAPILVMGGIFPDEIKDLIHYDLSTTLSTKRMARAIAAPAAEAGKPVKVHIKIDTGMGRLGVSMDEFICLVDQVIHCKNLHIEGICTHLATADEEDPDYTLLQLSRFHQSLDRLKQGGISVPLVHCANSAAILKYSQSWFNMVRPGLMLYGALPSPALKPDLKKVTNHHGENGLFPVMQWKSKIIQVKTVPKGVPLSYGRKHVTQRDSVIATLPLGYADGLVRALSNKMQVLIKGRRVPQLGTICMDMCLIDVTDVPGVEAGDETVIFGRQGNQTITVEEFAEWSGAIPYETLCAVGKRVPRVYT